MDIRELLKYLRAEASDRAVQRGTGMHRKTVKRYRQWAKEQGLLQDSLPPLGELEQLLRRTLPEFPPPQNQSSLEPYRELVSQLLKAGVRKTAMLQRLRERGYGGSYSSVRRFVQGLSKEDAAVSSVMVRVEVKPGEEAQVDFGFAGELRDSASGQLRRAWAFVMTLSFSRHQYVEFVFDQKLATWLLLHRHAFEYFGGVPQRIVIDNLKAAIVQACFDDPLVQQAYRECAEHYGFLIAPCRPATPRHKGKVERGVGYIKGNFLAGRTPTSLAQANQEVRQWCLTTAGERIHGTTKERPLVRFANIEQAQLLPLPTTPYDLAIWKEVTVSRDGHITFEQAYYSVPLRFPPGSRLRVRGGAQFVTLYTLDHQLLATHDRAQHAGERLTHPDHLPPEKVPGLWVSREECQVAAADIGPATQQLVQRLLDDRIIDRRRTALRLLRLRERFGDARLEAACHRALYYGEPTYATVKRILADHLEDAEQLETESVPAPTRTFARSAFELLGHLFGGGAWN